MLEFLMPHSQEDAINLLKADHDKVKDMFVQFEKADNRRTKKKIAAEAIKELKIHAELEEKIFYATVRGNLEDNVMNEADEEHHVAKVLIAELETMDGSEEHFDAKFHVLAENIRHHIREEEGKMLPEARGLDIDYEKLGQKMLAKKEQLMEEGVPPSAEAKMVAKSRGRGDSPAATAAKSKSAKNSSRSHHTA